MLWVLCVFTSRKDAMALMDYAHRLGIRVAIVNTPREVSASCGISVKAPWQSRNRLVGAASQLSTFVGAYALYENGFRQSVTRL